MKARRKDRVMNVVDVIEPRELSRPCPQIGEAMTKVREVVYPVRLFHNVDIREIVDEHKVTHEKALLDSVNLWLID